MLYEWKNIKNIFFPKGVWLVSEEPCCKEVVSKQSSKLHWLTVQVSTAVTAISLHPVSLSLHLHQPRDGPLEGKDLLLSCEQSESLCCILKKEG